MGTLYLAQTDRSEKTYLDVDPIEYESEEPRRMSSHRTDGGSQVHQDFGVYDADRTIRLRTMWMSKETLWAFEAKFREQATTWLLHDHWGDEYHVIFVDLRPTRRRGTPATYEVRMEFGVIKQSLRALAGQESMGLRETGEVVVV